MGVEPTSPAWEAGVITIIRRPPSSERRQCYYSRLPGDRFRSPAGRSFALAPLDFLYPLPRGFGYARG